MKKFQTAEQEKQLREQVGKVGGLEFGAYTQAAVEEPGRLPTSNGWYVYKSYCRIIYLSPSPSFYKTNIFCAHGCAQVGVPVV